jgi:non-heme Fe2+,alpha-ketoglutarate-dependent halogenase
MHASHPHAGKTNEMRLGFVSRYVPTSVLVYPDTQAIEEYGDSVSLARYGTVLVAGRDDYGHNRQVTHTTQGKPFALPRQVR